MKTKKMVSIILTLICMLSVFSINYNICIIDSEAASIAGDANGDGKLNVRDAAFIAQKAAIGKLNELPSTSDYNGDGKVNIRDAAAIAKKISSSSISKVTTVATTTKISVKTTTTKSTVSSIPSTVYITKTGKRYHYDSKCNGGTYFSCSYKDAIAKGLTPCQKCVH